MSCASIRQALEEIVKIGVADGKVTDTAISSLQMRRIAKKALLDEQIKKSTFCRCGKR